MSKFVSLGEHVQIQKGKAPLALGNFGKEFEPYLNTEYLRGRAQADFAKAGSDAVRAIDGDTILLWDGSNAGEFFKAKRGLVASTMAKISPSQAFSSAYFFHAVKRVEFYLKAQTNGTGIPHVDREVLEATKVFCPDGIEQQAIAEILDALDHAIQETEKIIFKLEAIKRGLLHDLLTRGIDANGELRPTQIDAPHLYKESLQGWLPLEWSARPLSAYTASEITYGIVQAGPHIPGGVPYIRTGDMSGDALIRENMLCTSKRIAGSYSRSEVKAGDIVMAIRATVGKVLPVTSNLDGANLTQGTAKISPNNRTDSVFLMWSIRHSRTQRAIQLEIKGTTFAEITLGALRRVLVAAPNLLEEQREIGKRLTAIDNQISSEQQKLNKWHLQKQGLMDDLLTGRVRVTPLLNPQAAA